MQEKLKLKLNKTLKLKHRLLTKSINKFKTSTKIFSLILFNNQTNFSKTNYKITMNKITDIITLLNRNNPKILMTSTNQFRTPKVKLFSKLTKKLVVYPLTRQLIEIIS